MVGLLRPVFALFISAAIVLCGNGLENVLLPFRADLQGFTNLQIGLIGSSFWLGVTAGCLFSPRVVGQLGHLRAFTLFTAIAAVSPLLAAVWQAPLFWWALRAIAGACFAGILTVVESWLGAVAPNGQRGQILSAYTITNFGGLVVGAQFMNLASPAGFQLFTVAALLFLLAGVPLALALTLAPPPSPPREPTPRPAWLWRLSPAAFGGCLAAGLANGAFWALGPVYAKNSGLPVSLVAFFMGCAVLGGALSQWPFGKWSEGTDRRRALMFAAIGAAGAGVLLYLFAGGPWPIKVILGLIFGACALPVYFISIAHANDYASASESADASSNLLLVLTVASIVGPILGSAAASAFGPGGIFLYTALIHAGFAAFAYRRMKLRPPPKDREAYVAIPERSSPSLFGMDPRAEAASEKNEGDKDSTPVVKLRLISIGEGPSPRPKA